MKSTYLQSKAFLALCLFFIAMFVALDIFEDYREGASNSHLVIEVFILALSSVIFLYTLSSWIYEKNQSKNLKNSVHTLGEEKSQLQKELQDHMLGLSKVIEDQFNKWKLTKSEQEVGFLLLKGMSLKEIADIRSCSEKTVQAQSQAIYRKTKCRGRSEFSAYFLEDLLPPSL